MVNLKESKFCTTLNPSARYDFTQLVSNFYLSARDCSCGVFLGIW